MTLSFDLGAARLQPRPFFTKGAISLAKLTALQISSKSQIKVSFNEEMTIKRREWGNRLIEGYGKICRLARMRSSYSCRIPSPTDAHVSALENIEGHLKDDNSMAAFKRFLPHQIKLDRMHPILVKHAVSLLRNLVRNGIHPGVAFLAVDIANFPNLLCGSPYIKINKRDKIPEAQRTSASPKKIP